MTSERRRLHPAAVGAESLTQLRGLLLPIVVVAVVGGSGGGDPLGRAAFFALAGALLSVVVAFVQWRATEWWVDGQAVRLKRGVFTVSETSVPLDRVKWIR